MLTKVSSSSVTISWNSTVDIDVMSYMVQYRRNATSDHYVEISVWMPQVTVVGLDAETTYEFCFVAVNIVGHSPSASCLVVTTPAGFSLFVYTKLPTTLAQV